MTSLAKQLSGGYYMVSWRPTCMDRAETHVFELEGHTCSYQVDYLPPTVDKGTGLQIKVLPHQWLPPNKWPSTIIAIKDNNVSIMAESTKGCWGPFYWKLYSNRESRASVVSHAPFDFNFSPSPSGPTFRLILGFHPQLDHGEKLILTHLHQLHDNQSMTDVQFIVKGQKMGGHLNILTTGSPVLSAMFGSDFMERQTRTLEIDDIEPEVFKQMLCYLYTGKAPDLERDDVTEALLIAADKYQIDSLKLLCEESLSFKLKVENVVHLLTLAHHHSANKLLEVILKFIAVHKREVLFRSEWRDLMVRSPELFLKTVEKMVVS